MASYRGFIVSHTHWDRAWYLPFEAFRVRLVRLVDRLLDLLDENPAYRAFTLDGQTVLLEDYLDVRPEQEGRLRRLIAEERLHIGPWYTLPDLFLVSGEAVIRNLQEGQRMCEAFGGEMPVGYIPDPFGHFAQMPQILQGMGLDTYLFMRGLHSDDKAEHGSVFYWEAPSGDRVLAVYQRDGYFPAASLGYPGPYGQFEGLAPDPALAREQIQEAIERMGSLQASDALLLSNGFDHMPEQPELPALLETLNEKMGDVDLRHSTLPAFVDALTETPRDYGVVRGDLIGNADHPVLQNVYSARIYLKQQNHRAQRLLTRYAEPMSAWLDALGKGPDARPILRHAWKKLMRNHPHDDICGCSVDAVHEDGEMRFRHVEETGTTLLVEHLEHLCTQGGFEAPAQSGERSTDVWVFNPHPWRVSYRVETTILIPNPENERRPTPAARPLRACLSDGTEIPVHILNTEGDVMRNHYLEQTWGRRYTVSFEVEVPPLGYHLVHLYEDTSRENVPQIAAGSASSNTTNVLENSDYRLTVEEGQLNLLEKDTGRVVRDLLRFEYQLDAGDTYSFGPLDHGPWWAELNGCTAHPTKADTLRLHHLLTVPADYDRDDGPQGETTLELTTDVRLGRHRAVEVDVQYENTAKNGRLRAVWPTGTASETAYADAHFRVAERTKPPHQTPDSHPERYGGYPGELQYPTQHQGDFVLFKGEAHRTWIANRGLPEYELLSIDDETQAAITLHRAVDMLSVEGGRIRWCQAGPSVPTPGAQCQRSMQAQLAYGTGSVAASTAMRHGRAFAHPAWVREMPSLPHVTSKEQHPRTQGLVQIDNPAIELSTWAPAPAPHTQTLRLYNRSAAPQKVTITIGVPVQSWCPSSLKEEWNTADARVLSKSPAAGHTLTINLDPHAIQTVLLR